MSSAMEKLWQEGRQEGIQEGQLITAYDIFKMGKMTLDEIFKTWGISALEIQNFAKQQEKIN